MAIASSWSKQIGVALLLIAWISPGQAQTREYPSKPIRMLVGFGPGSGTDIVARVIAKGIGDRLGQPVVVENRPGAGGIIAVDAVAKAPADGYTVLTVSSAISMNPAIYKNLAVDPERDLTSIAYIGALPTVMSIHKSVPARDLRELIELARAKPGFLRFGSSGQGASTHMFTELLASMVGIRMVHVPYKSGPQATMGLLAGEVDVLLDTIILTLPHLGNENARRLAITGTARSPLAPGIPTFAEAGLPAFDVDVWFGVLGPAGLPKEVVAQLNGAVNATLASPEAQSRLGTNGGVVLSPWTSDRFGALVRGDLVKWKRVAQQAGVVQQ